MPEKEFLIRSVPMMLIDGSPNVPTVLYFADDYVEIGQAALRRAREQGGIVNQDFKLDLGNIDPRSSKARTKFKTSRGQSKSASELTGEFLHLLIQRIRAWADNTNVQLAPAILVAEPLPSQEDPSWLINYRSNIRRILQGKGFEPEKIDFLPEPFAVFQYYRYGERSFLLLERKKHRVLVVDFGGGTFDACVIETTKEGDVSYSGRNQTPLAARSEPVGGYLIDRYIAEQLLNKTITKGSRPLLSKGLEAYSKWRKGEVEDDTLAEKYQAFIRHFHRLIYRSEELKLKLCTSIENWELDADPRIAVSTDVPIDPFVPISDVADCQLTAVELRDLFVQRIWQSKLGPIVRDVIQSGRKEAGGAPIEIALLSGGSANIRWLRKLLLREFGDQFSQDRILNLEDFQEVVAKGLAIECARRFYSDDGDFGSVTYNPLFVALHPDGSKIPLVRFRSNDFGDVKDEPGMLIPVGTKMTDYVGKKLRWKFRVPHPPKRHLDYYFFRASSVQQNLAKSNQSFDLDANIEHVQNFEQRAVHTPKGVHHFDAHLQLEISIGETGTAEPKFVYATGKDGKQGCAVTGRPFYLDMSPIQAGPRPKAYLGLDFGTSNSSVSFLNHQKIEVYKTRVADDSWKEISELVGVLPYPAAVALAAYVCESDPRHLGELVLDFTEGALALASYITYLEWCALQTKPSSKNLKGFTQRSAGPLWGLLKTCSEQLGRNADWSKPYRELFEPQYGFDEFINDLALVKHKKKSIPEVNHLMKVRLLANVTNRVFGDHLRFGYFQNVKQDRFSQAHSGRFTIAHGDGYFIRALNYSGQHSFSDLQAFAVSADGRAIALEPLLFWEQCPVHTSDRPHCFLFDSSNKDNTEFEFKAAGLSCTLKVDGKGSYAALAQELQKRKIEDRPVGIVSLENLRSRSLF
jgi:molecular chaperone DnaK (HSP70)